MEACDCGEWNDDITEYHQLNRTNGRQAMMTYIRRLLLPLLVLLLLVIIASAAYLYASYHELTTGQRILPWSAYALCGGSTPETLPATVRVGLYEEFPTPERLARLEQVDFPVDLAVAAPDRESFLALRDTIERDYPQVETVYWWPLLTLEEGYYPGTLSDADAVQRGVEAAEGLPVLWDMEPPLRLLRGEIDIGDLSMEDWQRNRVLLDTWLRQREEPVHMWRIRRPEGIDPPLLRLLSLHYDPHDYTALTFHLGLYDSPPDAEFYRIVRCGVERYGERFVPALGSLDDGEGPPELFLPPERLQRNLQLAHAAGVTEVWLFQVSGLNETTLPIIRETLPLDLLPHSPITE